MIDKIKVKVPPYPCADCEREAVCNYKKGCYAWKYGSWHIGRV